MLTSSSRIRILHICSGNLYGGIERFLHTLAAQRDQCPGLQPEFALCFEGRLADELRATGAAVHLLGGIRLSRPWTTWRARQKLLQLLHAGPSFDLAMMHGCWQHAALAPAVRRGKAPLWFWAHDSYQNPGKLDRLAARFKPDFVVGNSRFTLGTVPGVFPGVPGEVLYYPIAPPPAMDRAEVRREVRELLGCAPDKTVIFMGARLEPWKGHALLLDALALVPPGDWEAWIAGGPQRPHEEIAYNQLQAKATALGIGPRIRWLGQRNDMPRLLAAADIHCQPNTGPEPFGIVFIEALQAGLPVITTRLGAPPEIVDDTCGILTSPGDAAALAGALKKVMDPQARQQFSGGVARAKSLCDPASQLQKLRGLIIGKLPEPQLPEPQLPHQPGRTGT
jgi:glycosyltransferase involved in cell wall biosynthesis